MPSNRRILITGAAGFIGFHLAKKLLENDWFVLGVDNLDSYYSVQLKMDRLSQLHKYPKFRFDYLDINTPNFCSAVAPWPLVGCPVVHLAAQAGVRCSSVEKYLTTNIQGFYNVLLEAVKHGCSSFYYASSSSVYGANRPPFVENQRIDKVLSIYAATKRFNELIANVSRHLIPMIGFRFFSVYGAWGRPDMVLSEFSNKILNGDPLPLYNFGNMERNFTYVDDIAEMIARFLEIKYQKKQSKLYNLGNPNTVSLHEIVANLEQNFQKKAKIDLLAKPPEDIIKSSIIMSKTFKAINKGDPLEMVSIEQGVKVFVEWFKEYYRNGYIK